MNSSIKDKDQFFSLYLDQTVSTVFYSSEIKLLDSTDIMEGLIRHINLKDIKYISGSDLKDLVKTIGLAGGLVRAKSFMKDFEYNMLTINDAIKAIDFLRSRGYLIGFKTYTAEEIIELGWAKLY